MELLHCRLCSQWARLPSNLWASTKETKQEHKIVCLWDFLKPSTVRWKEIQNNVFKNSFPSPICPLGEKKLLLWKVETAWVQTKFSLNMSSTGYMLTGTNCFASLRLIFFFYKMRIIQSTLQEC